MEKKWKCESCNEANKQFRLTCKFCFKPKFKFSYCGCPSCDLQKKVLYNAETGKRVLTFTCQCDIDKLMEKLEKYKVSIKLDNNSNIVLNIGQEFFVCKKISPFSCIPQSEFTFKYRGEKLRGYK